MDYNLSKYKNVTKWYAKIKSEAPKYEEYNNAGVKAFKDLVHNMTKKWKAKHNNNIRNHDFFYVNSIWINFLSFPFTERNSAYV